MQIVCYRDLHGHDYLPQEQVCEMNCLYRTELVCEMNCLYRTELVCRDGAEAALPQPAAEAVLPQPAAEALDVSDQEPTQAAQDAYRCPPRPKSRDTNTNPDNGGPTRLSTSHSHIQGSPPVEQLPVPAAEAAELLQPGQELQHILALAGKVCNQGCRKICLFRRDFPRDQYVAQGHECYNRYIRQESILSMLSTKFLLYFS